MHHWVDPASRGIYDHPAAPPPRPFPQNANDVGARLARVEEHINFSASNQHRIEMESRLRAKDLASGIGGLDARITVLERDRHTRKHMLRLMGIFGRSAHVFVKFLIAGILGTLLLTGKASIETIKLLGGWLGLPGGG